MEAVALKEKLNHARELCPGMCECDYQFAKYLATELSDMIMPKGVILTLSLLFNDVQKIPKGMFPTADYYVVTRKRRRAIISQAKFVLQIIDAITDSVFSETVRCECEKTFGWKVVRRVKTPENEDYPPNVKAAVDWWTGQIQRQGTTIEVGGMPLPALTKEFTVEEIQRFRSVLANEIMFNRVSYLSVDYYPDIHLSVAGKAAGIDDNYALFLFPSKVSMSIYQESVTVYSGNSKIEIWHSDSLNEPEELLPTAKKEQGSCERKTDRQEDDDILDGWWMGEDLSGDDDWLEDCPLT